MFHTQKLQSIHTYYLNDAAKQERPANYESQIGPYLYFGSGIGMHEEGRRSHAMETKVFGENDGTFRTS